MLAVPSPCCGALFVSAPNMNVSCLDLQKKGKDGDPYLPGRVTMPPEAKVVQLSAGQCPQPLIPDQTLQ